MPKKALSFQVNPTFAFSECKKSYKDPPSHHFFLFFFFVFVVVVGLSLEGESEDEERKEYEQKYQNKK